MRVCSCVCDCWEWVILCISECVWANSRLAGGNQASAWLRSECLQRRCWFKMEMFLTLARTVGQLQMPGRLTRMTDGSHPLSVRVCGYCVPFSFAFWRISPTITLHSPTPVFLSCGLLCLLTVTLCSQRNGMVYRGNGTRLSNKAVFPPDCQVIYGLECGVWCLDKLYKFGKRNFGAAWTGLTQ